MEVTGSYLGLSQDKELFAYFQRHYMHFFLAVRGLHRTTAYDMKHPFLTIEKGFVPVAQKLGKHMVEAGNRTGVVTGWKSVPGAQTMYNLEVTQDHTYTVGDGQWVVHKFAINLDGLELIEGRAHVFLVPGNLPLDISSRVSNFGETP